MIKASELLDGPIDEVFGIITSDDFYREVAGARKIETEDVKRQVLPDGGVQIEIVRIIAPERLPKIARQLISGPVRVTQIERWTRATDSSGWTGRTQVSVPRLPIKLRGIQELRQTPEGLLYSVTGEIGAAIPLLSERLSKAAKPVLERMVARQGQHVRKHLRPA